MNEYQRLLNLKSKLPSKEVYNIWQERERRAFIQDLFFEDYNEYKSGYNHILRFLPNKYIFKYSDNVTYEVLVKFFDIIIKYAKNIAFL